MEKNSGDNGKARLELLGIGSAKNRALKANLLEALNQLDIEVVIEEVQHIDELLKYDISGIPALVVNGRVVFQRIVPSVEDLKIVLSVLLKKEGAARPVRQIVVPIDFSGTAENAFRFGLELAQFLGAGLSVLHVHNPQVDVGKTFRLEVPSDVMPLKQRMLRALGERLLRARRDNPALENLEVKTSVVSGQVAEEICRVSRSGDTDLIVMGTTGESHLLGNWFGSVATQVARCAECPVLLIPDGVGFRGFGKVIYASNYHPSEERILPRVVDFIHPFSSTVFFAHINQTKTHRSQGLSAPEGQVFHKNGVTFQLTAIESHDVVDGLSRFADESDAQLMVMTTTHRNFFEELFHKSATRKMIFNTRIPLMILHD